MEFSYKELAVATNNFSYGKIIHDWLFQSIRCPNGRTVSHSEEQGKTIPSMEGNGSGKILKSFKHTVDNISSLDSFVAGWAPLETPITFYC